MLVFIREIGVVIGVVVNCVLCNKLFFQEFDC